MKIRGGWFLTIAALSLALVFVSSVRGDRDEEKVRWDILGFDAGTNSVVAGGPASATAADGSQITLTGSGTFDPGDADSATGGGTWQIQGPGGGAIRKGKYQVTRLVRFDVAPGTLVGAGVNDGIGNINDTHAGLVVLAVRYSDGSRGVLVVSCSLIGTPANVFEGVTASKGAVDFVNFVAPPAGTLFHIRKED